MDPFDSSQDEFLTAQAHFEKGEQNFMSGRFDAALTEYRRAVLSDPQHFEAHLKIGLLLKSRAQADPTLLRHAFDSLKKAAALNRHHQQAQDEYILMAKHMGRFDELLDEYDKLIKENPQNDVLQKSKKNIVAISMALVPDKINIATASASSFLKKTTLMGSLGAIVLGLLVIFVVPPLLKQKLSPAGATSPMKGIASMGIIFCLGGLGGLFFYSKIK